MATIKMVAAQELMLGEKLYNTPPPTAYGRSEAYTFHMSLAGASALVKQGKAFPAFEGDCLPLRKAGVACRPFWGVHGYSGPSDHAELEPLPEPLPEPEPEDVSARPAENLGDIVMDAIASNKKSELVHALTLVGLNPDDYTNNAKRAEALEAWLDAS